MFEDLTLNPEATATATTSSASEASLGAASVGQDDFLRMLIAQLENQDPLNPQDPTQFTSQLAEFTSLEQLVSMRTALDEMRASLDRFTASFGGEGDLGTALELIGKQVYGEGDQVELTSGSSTETVLYELDEAATGLTLRVRDAQGATVLTRTLLDPDDTSTAQGAGRYRYDWDGTDGSGPRLPDGVYRVELVAVVGDRPVGTRTFMEGEVTGATPEGELLLGSRSLRLDALTEIRK